MKRLAQISVALLLLAVADARAATIQILPATIDTTPGSSVSLDVVVSDLGASVLADFDLDITFDPSALNLTSYTFGSPLGDPLLGDALDFSLGVAGGTLNIALVSTLTAASLDALQTSPFTIATLLFDVVTLAPGTETTVQVAAVNALGDAEGLAIPVGALQGARLTNPSSTTPNPVPEPASLLLLASGIALRAMGARRSARRTRLE